MRYRAWLVYNDWVIVFGWDRATGDHANLIQHVLNNLMNKKTQDSPTFVQDDFGDNNNDMNESYDVSFSGGERNTSSRTKQRVKK